MPRPSRPKRLRTLARWDTWRGQSTYQTAAPSLGFLANTMPVATVIALSENLKASKVWSEFFLWTFPYYAMGTGVAAIVGSVRTAVWISMLPAAMIAYGVYLSYTMYVARAEAMTSPHATAASAGR